MVGHYLIKMSMIEGISIVALTTAVTQLLKPLIRDKFVPISAVVFAVVISLASMFAGDNADWFRAVFMGLVYGLTANGLYDQVTKPFKK